MRSREPSLAQMCSFFSFTSSSLSHLISLSPNIPPNIKLSKQLLPLLVTMGAFLLSHIVTEHIRLLLEDTGSRRAEPCHKRLPSKISTSSSSLAAKPNFLLQACRGGHIPLGTTRNLKASEPSEAIWMLRAWLHPCHGQKPLVGAGA